MNTACTEPGLIESLVYGRAADWEKHEIGAETRFVKPITAHDPLTKAQVARRYDELGFVPMFFREGGAEFVALEGIKQQGRYTSVEQAFVEQILGRIKGN